MGSRRSRRRRCIRGAIGTGNRTTTARGRGRRSRPRRSTRSSRAAASRERWVEMKKGTRYGWARTNVIVDPCCGGGTILHAAWSRGYHSIGGDVNAQIVRNAQGNIASFVPAMPAAHATLRGIDEASRSRPLRSTLEKTRIGPRALARIARGRAKPPGFSRRRRGSTRRTPRPHPRTGSQTPRIGSNATNGTST